MRARGPSRVGRTIGYARVSSQEQALGTSLQDQQDALKAFAKARGLTIERFFVEAESAVHEKFERREQMQTLMRELRSGDLVLCDKLDRWSRDPEFTYRSMREIREAGASVYFVGEQLDPSTPEGDSLLGFRVAFAREEHKRIRLRTVGTRRILRDQGLYVEGLPPLGYRRQLPRGSRGLEKNVLVANDDDAKLVRNVFNLCIRGAALSAIIEHLQTVRPDRRWDKSGINKVLHNRVYLGEIKNSHGVWIRGKHVPIVDPGTFDRAKRAIDSRRLGGAKPRGDSHTSSWLLRGLAVCGSCGTRMSSAYGAGFGNPVRGYFFYYRCLKKCGARYVPVKANDDGVGDLVIRRLAELREHLATAKPPNQPMATETVDFAAKRAVLTKKQERIVDAFTDGLMAREKMHAEVAKLDTARTRLDAAEADQRRRRPLADSKVRIALLRLVTSLRKAWTRATVAQRRAILAQLATGVRVERDEDPVVLWRSLDELAEEVSRLDLT